MTTTTATDSAATADNNHDSHNDASLQTPAPSARPEGNGGRLFSPRSTAALALSSIITQREEGTENDHPNQNNNNEEDEDSGNESPNDRVSKTSTDNHHHHHHDKDDEAKLLKAPVQNTPPDHPYSHPSAVPYYNNGDNNNHHGYHPNLPPQSYHPSHMAPHMAPHMPPSYRQPLQVKSSSSSTTSSSGANMMDNTPSNNNRWWMPPPPPPPPGYYNMGRHPSYPPPPVRIDVCIIRVTRVKKPRLQRSISHLGFTRSPLHRSSTLRTPTVTCRWILGCLPTVTRTRILLRRRT